MDIPYVDLMKIMGKTHYDDMVKRYSNKRKYAFKPFTRTIIAGESGCGKTTLLTQILVNSLIKMEFDEIWLVVPDDGEDSYQALIKYYKNIKEQIEVEEELEPGSLPDIVKTFNKPSDLPDLSELKNTDKHIVLVFDDMVSENAKTQKLISDYFIASRKKFISCFYLTQDLYGIHKLARRNTNYVIVFPCSKTERDLIAREYCSSSQGFKDRLSRLNKYEFILIDKTTTDRKMKFRKGFKTPLFK